MNIRRAIACLVCMVLLPTSVYAQQEPDSDIARFRVNKIMLDFQNLDADITFQMRCNGGHDLVQEITLPNDILVPELTFTLASIPEDGVDFCEITELDVTDYDPFYHCLPVDVGSDSDHDSEWCGGLEPDGVYPNPESVLGCRFENIEGGDFNRCYIYNVPKPATFTITKEWELDGPKSDEVSTLTRIHLMCDNLIEPLELLGPNMFYRSYILTGEDPDPLEVEVHTILTGEANCEVWEEVVDSYVEMDDDCAGFMSADVNGADDCTFTNTVFFEGIPTLSHFGMALMALLMLGVGFIGMRRIV